MLAWLAKRLIDMIPTFFGITLISFAILHLAPGKPTDVLTEMNPKITPEARLRLEKYYGLDKPLHEQYVLWLKRVVKLDFGESFASDHRPVWDKIRERLPVTINLNLISMALMLAIAVPVGVSSAVRAYSLYDKITTVIVFIGFAAPTFWLALLLMMFFGVTLDLLPISGLKSMDHDTMGFWGKTLDYARHIALPILAGTIGSVAGLSRYMRSNMLEVVRQDFITTARAKGLSERVVIYRHALRNALLPVITILGLSVPGLIGGSVIMENIFSIPGMGQFFYQALMTRDYPSIMGVLTIGAALTLAGNLLADVGYAASDPRIRAR
ncbi:MAG: ABC transporter permease [Nitrospirae bacterium]|nr:ABC transporter permease [Nitrospirota bacterium]